MHAFAGESMARNKYTYYAAKAKEEGYEQKHDKLIRAGLSANQVLPKARL